MLGFAAIRGALEARWRAVPLPFGATASARVSTAGGPPAPRSTFRWQPVVAQAAALWAMSRVALLAYTFFALHLSVPAVQVRFGPPFPDALYAAWQHWDANWYFSIARLGYWNPQSTAFFPLFPLLIQAISLLLGPGQLPLAAWLAGNLGTLLAFAGLALLAAQEDTPGAAPWALRALVVYPLAFFLAAPYTEGLFLGLAAFALFFARRGAWRWAALCALLAALTRLTALILILPLLWELARRSVARVDGRWRWTGGARELGSAALLLAAVPAGFALYAAYLGARFGNPLIFLSVEQVYWHHQGMPLWQSLPTAIGNLFAAPPWSHEQARMFVDYVPLALFATLTFATLRRVPVAFSLYMLGLLFLSTASPIPGNGDIYLSAGRYLLAAAPIFLLAGRWMRRAPWLDLLLTTGGVAIQAVLAAQFISGNWII